MAFIVEISVRLACVITISVFDFQLEVRGHQLFNIFI